MARSEKRLQTEEDSWTATETRLNKAMEAAKIEAGKVQSKLELTQSQSEKELAKVQAKRDELGERLKQSIIRSNTNSVKFKAGMKAKETELEGATTQLEERVGEKNDLQNEVKEQRKELHIANGRLDKARDKQKEDQAELHKLHQEIASLKKDLAAEQAKSEGLQHAVNNLEQDIAAEQKSARHFKASVKTFQLIGNKVNDTMAHVMRERQRALLISQDLLKVNAKLRGLLTDKIEENSKTKRALAFFYASQNHGKAGETESDESDESTTPEPDIADDSLASQQSSDSDADAETTEAPAADAGTESDSDSETTEPAEARFASRRSKASRLRDLFYNSIGKASRP